MSPGVERIQLGRFLAHVLLDRIRVLDVAERDLERKLHSA
jgi:hypothetical protein